MGPRCISAETHVCHRSYIIVARLLLEAKSVAQQQIVDSMLKDFLQKKLPMDLRLVCDSSDKSSQLSITTGNKSDLRSAKALLKTGLTELWSDIAQQQIVDSMLKDYDPTTMTGNTLHSDATSKFFKHYESFQVTLPDGNSMWYLSSKFL
jgi:stress-induced morphogen